MTGLQPKINIWTTDGAEGAADSMAPLRNLSTALSPMVSVPHIYGLCSTSFTSTLQLLCSLPSTIVHECYHYHEHVSCIGPDMLLYNQWEPLPWHDCP